MNTRPTWFRVLVFVLVMAVYFAASWVARAAAANFKDSAAPLPMYGVAVPIIALPLVQFLGVPEAF